MISIEKWEFSELKNLGTGTFGTVYEKDGLAIKRYHSVIKGNFDQLVSNPCLRFYRKRINRLLHKSNNIKYTDLIHDKLYINGFFQGVCYKLQDGYSLDKVKSITTFKEKKIICEQWVRNAKELIDNQIYHYDFKPNNAKYTSNKEVKILDTDDCFTKITLFPNPFLKRKSMFSLKRALMIFLDEDTHYYVDNDILKLLTNYHEGHYFYNKKYTTYNELYNYIEKRFTPLTFCFLLDHQINDVTITYLKKILSHTDLKIVIYFDNGYLDKDYYINSIIKLKENDIPIFDVIIKKYTHNDLLNEYINNYNIQGYYNMVNEKIYYNITGEQPPKVLLKM